MNRLFRWGPPMFRFTIRDVLWLTVVVGMSVAWWAAGVRWQAARNSILAKQSLLFSQRDAALAEGRRLASENKILAEDFWLMAGSLQKLRIDPVHIVSAARVADRNRHDVQVLIEPRPPIWPLPKGAVEFSR
jgi:hypothetical protein